MSSEEENEESSVDSKDGYALHIRSWNLRQSFDRFHSQDKRIDIRQCPGSWFPPEKARNPRDIDSEMIRLRFGILR